MVHTGHDQGRGQKGARSEGGRHSENCFPIKQGMAKNQVEGAQTLSTGYITETWFQEHKMEAKG